MSLAGIIGAAHLCSFGGEIVPPTVVLPFVMSAFSVYDPCPSPPTSADSWQHSQRALLAVL